MTRARKTKLVVRRPALEVPDRDWTPRRYGNAYCSPACGGGPVVCSFERYKRAKAAAETVARSLGKGWTAHTSENLGWHAKVASPCRRIWISLDSAQNGKILGYMAFLGPPRDGSGGKWSEHGDTAREAITNVLDRALYDLGLIEGIVSGLLPPKGR